MLGAPKDGPCAALRQRRPVPGWLVTRAGIWKQLVREDGLEEVQIAHRPYAPLAIYRDQDTGEQYVEIGWLQSGHWHSGIFPRAELRDARPLVKLAGCGMDVGSDTARSAVAWLRAAEAAWEPVMGSGWCSRRLGWQGSRHQVFQLGTGTVAGPAVTASVKLVGLDEGQQRLAGAVRTRGSFDGWRAAVSPIAEHPLALLALYASLAAPLLSLLDLRPFGLDFSASTGTGKTTAAELAASAWGDPGLLRQSWGGRVAGIEATATMLCDLPLILDESTRIQPRQREEVSSLLYAITNGVGRTLGAPGSSRGIGLRSAARWRTVLISNGEAPILQWTQDEGVRVRILSIEGAPIPAGNKGLVDRAAHALARHHGHAGPALVHHLVDTPGAQDAIRARHEAIETQLVAKAPNDVFARQATWLAVLGVTQELLRDVLGCPWASSAPLDLVLATASALRVDSATAALREVYAWAATNESRFYGRHDDHKIPPVWLGSWQRDGDLAKGSVRWSWLGIECRTLETLLRDRGYHPAAILRDWHARGWLSGDSSAHRRGPAWIGGVEIPCYRLKRDAIDALSPSW
jgi:hypothetical protein